MALFDADFLGILLHPNPRGPLDPATKKPVARLKEKVEHLIESLEKVREKILIPTPKRASLLAPGPRSNLTDKSSPSPRCGEFQSSIRTTRTFEKQPREKI